MTAQPTDATDATRTSPRATATGPDARSLLDVRRIYLEPAAAELPRGREVLARWPEAEIVEVDSHWRIPSSRATRPTWTGGSGSRPRP
jgi:hypothetical protein